MEAYPYQLKDFYKKVQLSYGGERLNRWDNVNFSQNGIYNNESNTTYILQAVPSGSSSGSLIWINALCSNKL